MPPTNPNAPAGNNNWRAQLQQQLGQLQRDDLRRSLRILEHDGPIARADGADLINFASNDYLGLSQHPRLKDAVAAAVREHGTGSGASRLVTGTMPLHDRVERRFAQFKHAEAALVCPTGYMANLAAVTALMRKGDLILADKLCHASMIDAARASGATVRTFHHRSLDRLTRLLDRAGDREANARTMIMTDSVFSMDGDVADLPGLCEIADRHGAILYVDEAHGTGVLGETGAGLAEHAEVAERIDVTVSTASKALGSLGGIVTASREVIDTIINRGRAFIYTTGAPPAQAAGTEAALDLIHDEPDRRKRLGELADRVTTAATDLGWAMPERSVTTPIIPLIVGEADRAIALAEHLTTHGILAPAIRPPTVAPGSSRVRLSLRADLEDQHVERLIEALQTWQPTAPNDESRPSQA